jgi:cytochrome c oxidase cbb3-type subunit 3
MKFFAYLKQHKTMFISLIAVVYIMALLPLYAWKEPVRMEKVELDLLTENIDSAMTLYAENCALCHGMAGEGIGPNPPLNNPGITQMDYDTLFKIISFGRYNTTMPAWGQEDGGPLTDYEISQLVALMQNDWWTYVQSRVVNLGLQPLIPFEAEPDPELLASVAALPNGSVLAAGITTYAAQCVSCHGADGLGTNIASALNNPDLREQPQEEIENTILNGVSGTLMAGWKSILTRDEIMSLSTLIKEWDTIPSGTIPAPETPIHVTAESLQSGETLYAENCSFCHAAEGQGTPRAPSLNVKGFLEDTNDMAMQQIISLGVPDTSMLAWGTRLSEPEIQAIVGFIRAWEPTAPEVAVPARGSGNSAGGGRWQNPGSNTDGSKGPPWMREGYPSN